MSSKEIAKTYLEELKAESVSTRKCLERIPESSYGFKPHEKSMAMGYLVLLVAEIPQWISVMVESGEIDFATYKSTEPVSTKQMLAHYDACLQKAISSLQNATEEKLSGKFSLKSGGNLLYEEEKLPAIGSTLNHWVHHRGQLTVYMRLNDIAVPSIYGPSADEKTW
jgi:uncharacterized damage-inducible protein DinB